MPLKIVAGNWKMNGTEIALSEMVAISLAAGDLKCATILCPPSTLTHLAARMVSSVAIGGQNCHHELAGPHTGDISAEMFAQAGAQYVIVGHSERRECYGETDAHVQAKATATLRAGLTPIICIGETLAQRESGQTISVVSNQLSKSLPTQASVVIAYEPIWAIGTGIVPSLTQITEVHDALRALLVKTYGAPGKDISILYGGSVKPKNAPDIFSLVNVNGALVGGASLKALDFVPIMQALSDS
jgi:triosephosphate isomerase